MTKSIIIDKGEVVNSTDYAEKCERVIEELQQSLFANLEMDSYEDFDDTIDVPKAKKPMTFKKNEIMPTLTPMQVTMKLNRLLRVYKPMSLAEAKTVDDTEYLTAYGYYCDIISYINKYLVYIPDKQTFSAFVNITTDIYNELLQDPNYSQVFKSFEDSFIQSNFSASQAGIIDSKTTLSKLEMKDAGHNLIKNPEVVTNVLNLGVNKQEVNEKFEKWKNMARIGSGKK